MRIRLPITVKKSQNRIGTFLSEQQNKEEYNSIERGNGN